MAESSVSIPRELQLWGRLLVTTPPVIGGWIQRIALNRLSAALQRGDPRAVQPLVAGLRQTQKEPLHEQILVILSRADQPACRTALWEAWSDRRDPQLETILLADHQEAAITSAAWGLSLAKLCRLEALQDAPPGQISQLVALIADPDEGVASHARLALSRLKRAASQDEIFRQWAENRVPELWHLARAAGYIPGQPLSVKLLYLLKLPDLEELSHSPPEAVPYLYAALQDVDPGIAQHARLVLPRLQNPAAIDALIQLWQPERPKVLGIVIREGCLIATRPIELRLLSALKAGRIDLASGLTGEGIPILCGLLADIDPEIADSARKALLSLQLPAAQSALCQYAVEKNLPVAFELALQAGYLPEKPEQRALFLLLASQWREYETFDFDYRLMRAIFEASPLEMRQRIALQVQRSGKTAYLTILAGMDYRSNAAKLTEDEVGLLVELLTQNREWSRLWSLVHILSFRWSIRILNTLESVDWLPQVIPEQAAFRELVQLAAGLALPAQKDWLRDLPPAVSIARVKITGRINALCFSPNQPLIAIGTSTRKLALWNFHTATLERVRQGFNHSIANVAFVGEHFLTCGVRSNKEAACMIYGWRDDQAFVLPGHRGAVTGLQPIGDSKLISTGRDGEVIYWDLSSRSELSRRAVDDWPRAAVASPYRPVIALLNASISLVQLPNLMDISPNTVRTAAHTGTRRSVARCAIFPSDGNEVLVGQHNGQVVLYRQARSGDGLVRKAILRGKAPITGLEMIPNRQVLVTAVQNGRIQFHRWPDLSQVGSLTTESNRLLSLHVSPDGSFMATGSEASTMQLWDLRVQSLPDLIDLPLSQATSEHLAAINSALQFPDLSQKMRQSLSLLKVLLLRRFRYDIQVDELPQIQPGEFDILLD